MSHRASSQLLAVALLFAGTACQTSAPLPPVAHEATLPDVAAEPDEDWLFEDQQADPAERDDAEGLNRSVFWVNEQFYDYLADPVATAYERVVPGAGRRAVRRFFENLDQPVVLANDLIQFAPHEAGMTFSRFVVNTTLGVAGFFDPATHFGIEGHRTDFGETLGVYGVPSGSFLVIPLLGPATVRDALGEAVDAFMRPDVWLLGGAEVLLATTGSGLATYQIERPRLEALRETSVDFYAALRSAYLMDRDAHIADRIEHLGRGAPEADVAAGPETRCGDC